MKTMKLFLLVSIFISLSSLAQKKVVSMSYIRAIKFTELAPDLNQAFFKAKFTSRNFIEKATRNLDKAIVSEKNGKFYFVNRRGVPIQTFDLARLGIYRVGHYQWSPDGTMMLVSMRKDESSSLYLLKLDGSMVEVIPFTKKRGGVTQPSWSFDSRMFVYLKVIPTEAHEIWIKDMKKNSEVLVERIPMGEGACGNPVWFNQSARIVYRKRQSYMKVKKYIEELWIYDFDKNEKKKIYEGRVETPFPIISPDDTMIGTDTGQFFTLLDLEGNILKNLYIGPNAEPQWSPDGQFIAFLTGKVDPKTEILLEQHICVVDINTGEVKDLTPIPGLIIDAFRWYDENTIIY